jgi:HSP20 family protein
MDFSLFPRDLFAEVERLQRELQQAFDVSPSIRGVARGAFPPVNVAATADSAEIYAFAPGLDPKSLDVQIERGVLSISGQRAADLPNMNSSVHLNERFAGRFHRVITLAEDLDTTQVGATYRDGILHISVKRSEAAKPRRINIT